MIRDLYQKIAPLFVRKLVYRRMAHMYYRQYLDRINRLASDVKTSSLYKEELAEIARTKAIYMINRRYRREEYLPEAVQVYKDPACSMRYVLVEGKKLYYPRSWSSAQIRFYHNSLLAEMDKRSPHCYTSEAFTVPEGCVLMDLGGAEGIFTLLYIDKIAKAFLFECDPLWEEPLRQTFSAWQGKVSVEKLYIGDTVKEGFTTLDAFVESHDLKEATLFVKCDIEGAEEAFLRGASRSLAQCDADMAICLYHSREAEERITELAKTAGWSYSLGEGYLFPVGFEKDMPYPCFRRGMIRCSIRH